jgi:hypothetical protein
MVTTDFSPAHMLIFLLQRYLSSEPTLHRYTKPCSLAPSVHVYTKPFFSQLILYMSPGCFIHTKPCTCTLNLTTHRVLHRDHKWLLLISLRVHTMTLHTYPKLNTYLHVLELSYSTSSWKIKLACNNFHIVMPSVPYSYIWYIQWWVSL